MITIDGQYKGEIMKKFTPYDKLSKKMQKEIDNQKRNTWGAINPVTQVISDKKKYSRKQKHKGCDIND